MKFLKQCKADAIADLVYRACPMHLLEPSILIEDLKRGQEFVGISEAGKVPAMVKALGVDRLSLSSPALGAMGILPDLAQGSIVFTRARETREEEIHYVLEQLPEAVAKLRSFSPVWRKKMAAAGGQA
jgi:hypothetical protein